MALVTTIASATADSYVTVAEADAYLATRKPFNISASYTAWTELSEAEKETALKWAAMLIDLLRVRGLKLTTEQSLAWPRCFRGDDLYPTTDARADRWEDWEEVTDYCTAMEITEPTIPQDVKDAQVEIAFQVVHGYMTTLDPMEESSGELSSISIGGKLNVQFASAQSNSIPSGDLFNKSFLSAQTILKLKLRKYLTTIRGRVV